MLLLPTNRTSFVTRGNVSVSSDEIGGRLQLERRKRRVMDTLGQCLDNLN